MAKGFTVKASKPKKNKQDIPEWDYEAIKERWRGKKIVFCLPGRGVSYVCLLYTSPSPRDLSTSRMPSSAYLVGVSPMSS